MILKTVLLEGHVIAMRRQTVARKFVLSVNRRFKVCDRFSFCECCVARVGQFSNEINPKIPHAAQTLVLVLKMVIKSATRGFILNGSFVFSVANGKFPNSFADIAVTTFITSITVDYVFVFARIFS